MRKVGIRAFQQNFHKELKNLPFIVTKDGQDYCVVTPLTPVTEIANMLRQEHIATPKRSLVVTPHDIEMTQDAREGGKCEANKGTCRNLGYLYEVTYLENDGEHKEERFLCDMHLKKTKDSGMEVSEL